MDIDGGRSALRYVLLSEAALARAMDGSFNFMLMNRTKFEAFRVEKIPRQKNLGLQPINECIFDPFVFL
jgi:hypothetical protein